MSVSLTEENFLTVINEVSKHPVDFNTPIDKFMEYIDEETHETFILILENLGLPSILDIDEHPVLSTGFHNIEDYKFNKVYDFYSYIDRVISEHLGRR